MRRLTGPEKAACQRLDAILKARAGLLTATEAARLLGISRKTYYEWEERALTAATGALANRAAGRPTPPVDHEKQRLRGEVAALQQQVEEMSQALRIIQTLRPLVIPATAAASNRRAKKNSAKRG